MRRYRFSEQSRSDLDDIWLYIASDNVTAADRFIDQLVDKIHALAEEPGIGPAREMNSRDRFEASPLATTSSSIVPSNPGSKSCVS